MKIYRSKSFFFLVVSGLALVSLPLLVMLISSDVMMSRLVHHSSNLVYRSVTASQLSQTLVEQITNQERRIRQYLVLNDPKLYEDVFSWHQQIRESLDGLTAMPQSESQMQRINSLQQREEKMLTYFQEASQGIMVKSIYQQNLLEISSLAKDIFQHSNQGVYQEVKSLQNEAANARKILLFLAGTLLPVTIILVVLFTRLISKPIKEIDKGINLLGQGDFNTPIRVTGPEDLVFLGKRLNWLRQKLALYEKEKNKFAAHISHELKTPFASIHEASELLGDEIAGPLNGKQREVIEILRKNSSHLQELIENLVGYTMAQAQKTCLNFSEFDLDSLIEEVIDAHKPGIIKNNLTFNTQVDSFQIKADWDRLKIVMDNLFSNALKYTPSHGQLTVTARQEDKQAIIEVIDSGPGVPPNEKEKIFTPFFQGKSLRRSHVKGTGLGLAIATEYVEAHGGSLSLTNTSPAGACFRVVLPINCHEDIK